MTTRQFVAVRFRPGDRRTYTYHFDGPELAPGDKVKVPDRSGDGWQSVEVASVSFAEPNFATKAVLGKVQAEASLLVEPVRDSTPGDLFR